MRDGGCVCERERLRDRETNREIERVRERDSGIERVRESGWQVAEFKERAK